MGRKFFKSCGFLEYKGNIIQNEEKSFRKARMSLYKQHSSEKEMAVRKDGGGR